MNDKNLKTSKQVLMSDLLVNLNDKVEYLLESITEIQEALESVEAKLICVFPSQSGDQDE